MENAIETWSKSKQFDKIREILTAYPTAKDFKAAILKSGDTKSIAIINNLDDNASKSEYVDFLQYAFIKHSKIGKYLINAAAGLLGSAALAYLVGKAGERVGEEKRDELRSASRKRALKDLANGAAIGAGATPILTTAEDGLNGADEAMYRYAKKQKHDILGHNDIYGDDGKLNYNVWDPKSIDDFISNRHNRDKLQIPVPTKTVFSGALKNIKDAWTTDKDYTLERTSELLPKTTAAGALAGGAVGAADMAKTYWNTKDMPDDYKKYGQIGGAVGGGLGGAGIAQAIQNWREKKSQKNIEDLKK